MESFEDPVWAEHPKWPHVGSLNIHIFWWPGPKMVFAYTIERFAHPKDCPFEFTVVYQVFLSEGVCRMPDDRRVSSGDGSLGKPFSLGY